MHAPEPSPPRGPLPPAVGLPLAGLYRLAIGRINRRFDRNRGVVTFDRPVISVGNLSVGGTGKTPMVRRIVQWLIDAGHRPCIAMRGYASRAGESDEASAYRRELPAVPVVARSNRTLGLIQLFAAEHDGEAPHTDCIVLDDGFQHRQIARQLDIVLIDASRDPFRDRLLPAGWLREPVGSLRRAGSVVITHAESVSGADLAALDRRIAETHGTPAAAVCRHAWTELAVRRDGADESSPVSWLSGKRVLAVCAIGNPAPFMTAVQRAVGTGGAVAESIILRDHDAYAPATVSRIITAARTARAQAIVTTDKDWSKLAAVTDWPCPVARPRLEITFDRGEEPLQARVLDTVARGVPDDHQVMPKE